MAYGVTGSGKTYTLTGPNFLNYKKELEKELDTDGMIVRCLRQIFTRVQNNKEIKCKIEMAYIELYNDTFKDLLLKKKATNKSSIKFINKTSTVFE